MLTANSRTTVGTAVGVGMIVVMAAFYLGSILTSIEASITALGKDMQTVTKRFDGHLVEHKEERRNGLK